MTTIRKTVSIVLAASLVLSPLIDCPAMESYGSDQPHWEIITVDDSVGTVIDPVERDRFQLFQASRDYQSAIFLRSPHGVIVALIMEGSPEESRYRILECDEQIFQTVCKRMNTIAPSVVGTDTSELHDETPWEIVTINDGIGEIIDLDERNSYELFRFSKEFHSAVMLRSPDSTVVALITEDQDGTRRYRTSAMDSRTFAMLCQRLDVPHAPGPPSGPKFPLTGEDRTEEETPVDPPVGTRVYPHLKKGIRKCVEEKWATERWREEEKNDSGMNCRTAGSLFGFTLGAAVGMAVGKGFQGKKVDHQVFHDSGEWGNDWTENFYSYENRCAPHWGAAVGGVAGATAGYMLGKRADKRYYCSVPRNFRTMKPEGSWIGSFLFGFGVVGPVMAGAAGSFLATPASGRVGEKEWSRGGAIGGYFLGAVSGTVFMWTLTGRSRRTGLWERSFLTGRSGSTTTLELLPLDPTAFHCTAFHSPKGEMLLSYQSDILRLRF